MTLGKSPEWDLPTRGHAPDRDRMEVLTDGLY
jgi:hypothetical protein